MRRLEITAQARSDADAAYDWMAEHISPAFAATWYQNLFTEIETLKLRATLCPVARESYRFSEEIRELTHGKRRHRHKYRILFTLREDVVTVLYVYHSSRKELEP